MTTLAKKTTKLMKIKAKDMFIDETYQRTPLLRQAQLKKWSKEFDSDMAQVPTVSKRSNDKYAILDGGGRHHMVKNILGKPDFVFDCQVYTGLTIKQETEIYEKLNKQRKQLSLHDHLKADIRGGKPAAVQLWQTCKDYGGFNSERDIPAVKPFQTMQEQGILKQVLSLTDAWRMDAGRSRGKVSGVMYEAVALVLKFCSPLDERYLKEVFNRQTAKDWLKIVHRATGGRHPNQLALPIAMRLAKEYNVRLGRRPKITQHRLNSIAAREISWYVAMREPLVEPRIEPTSVVSGLEES
jgi:hypothetical protein